MKAPVWVLQAVFQFLDAGVHFAAAAVLAGSAEKHHACVR